MREKYTKKRNQIHNNKDFTKNATQAIMNYGVECVRKIQNIQKTTIQNISLYYPIRSEVNVIDLAQKLEQNYFEIALPVVIKKEEPLIFRKWHPLHPKQYPLTEGPWNIPQPKESAPVIIPQIMFVPLLAFDKDGFRLGYGGGFYDRTIKKNNPITIGVAYSGQYAQKIPIQQYDQKLNYVITENGIFNMG